MEIIIIKSIITATEKKKKKSRTNYRVNQNIRGICVRVRAPMHIQSCPTLCDPMDWSPPVSPVHGMQ